MARSRSGVGQFHLSTSRASRRTSPPRSATGRSAIVALAKKVIAIESLTDYDRGIILNVGTISGGTKRNIVPEHAEAWIDVRYDESAQGEEVQRAARADRRRANDGAGHAAPSSGACCTARPSPQTPESPTACSPLHREIARGLGYAAPEAGALRRRHRRLDHGRGRPADARLDGRARRRRAHRPRVRACSRVSPSAPTIAARAAAHSSSRERPARSGEPAGSGLPAGGAKLESPRSITGGDRWVPAGGRSVNPARSGRKQR